MQNLATLASAVLDIWLVPS